jgi:hypothetical protein
MNLNPDRIRAVQSIFGTKSGEMEFIISGIGIEMQATQLYWSDLSRLSKLEPKKRA